MEKYDMKLKLHERQNERNKHNPLFFLNTAVHFDRGPNGYDSGGSAVGTNIRIPINDQTHTHVTHNTQTRHHTTQHATARNLKA